MQQTTGQTHDGSFQWTRLALWSSVVLLAIAAFAGSLVMYMPARFAVKQLGLTVAPDRVSGTIWQGAVQLDAEHALSWETSGWQSLRRTAAVVNWRIIGPGTDLTGRVAVPMMPRADRAELDAVAGTVAWPLVAAVLPGLAIRCEARAKIAGLRILLTPGQRTAEGTVTSQPGSCERTDRAVPPVPTPALSASLTGDAEGLVAVLSTVDQPKTPLATARLTNADRIIVTIHAAGAALVPGMPSSADSEIELPLSVLLP